MATTILKEAIRAEFGGHFDRALKRFGLSEPGMSESDAWEPDMSEQGNADAGRPRAEVKCPEIRVQRLGEIDSEPTTWLSPDRFPLGTLTVLAGPSGVGKTFLALDLVAQVTRGASWPNLCARGLENGAGSGDEVGPGRVAGGRRH